MFIHLTYLMLKSLSVGSLLVLTTLVPAIGFAKTPSFSVHGQVKAAVRHDAQKPSTDVQVSLMGKVTALSGTNITVLGNNGSSYVIDASSARLVRRYGGTMMVSDIQLNDQIFVQGTLVGTAIKAKAIEDFSLQARNGTFSGTVQSVSGNSFVLKSQNRGMQTVLTSASTKFLKNGAVASVADVMVGATVSVDGIWNNTNNNLTANKVRVTVKQEQVRLNATVSAMNGTTLTLNGTDGKTYTVNVAGAILATSSYYGKEWTNLKVGDRVQVWGKMMTGSTQVTSSMVINFSS